MAETRSERPGRMPAGEIVRRSGLAAITVILIVVAALFLNQIRTILLWVLIGVILAIALDPIVSWLERHRWGRTLASVVVSLVTVAIVVGAMAALLIPLAEQTTTFITDLPQIVRDILGPGGSLYFIQERVNVIGAISRVTPSQVFNVLAGNRSTIITLLTTAASTAAAVITIITIMVMLLIEGPRAWRAVLDWMVEEERAWARRIGGNFLQAVGGYVRGNLLISIIAGVTSYLALRIVGTPYPETLAVFVALLDIIPLVGATIAAIVVILIGFATGGLTDGLVLLIFFIAYQQFENNVLQNVIYAKTVALSPLVVFIAALMGASVLGVVGVLLAIPLASAVWVLGRDLLQMRRAGRKQATQRGEATALPPPPDTGITQQPAPHR
jgi:predicted PurR-regulated permease PerM